MTHWPQIIVLAIICFNVVAYALLDGTEKKGKYSFAIKFCDSLIILGLLYLGGFFDPLLK